MGGDASRWTDVRVELVVSRILRFGVLLAAIIWSAARLYYFMFYVIEKYVDPGYRFAGVFACVRYLVYRINTWRRMPPPFVG